MEVSSLGPGTYGCWDSPQLSDMRFVWWLTHLPLVIMAVIFIVIWFWNSSEWLISGLLDLTDEESTLVQVMMCCHQLTSHYMAQCWSSSIMLHGVTLSQFIKNLIDIPPAQWSCWGYIGFTPSICPSIHPSIRLSVCPSIPHPVSAL